ncbi:MAG: glutamine synthetase beta-grasp domain-containing protein [Planctomycetota bacterium]|nr:glutamine synthetase beta-grasp domain-containing protein [Planctomycetota bacterium]
MTTPQKILALCRENDVKTVDIRFVDLPGSWHSLSIPVSRLDEELFENGLGFDGKRFRGWNSVSDSDRVAIPQPDTAFLDPCGGHPTLSIIADIHDPAAGDNDACDPRNVAWKTLNFLKTTSIADTACFGPEVEFYLFDGLLSAHRLAGSRYLCENTPGALISDVAAGVNPVEESLTHVHDGYNTANSTLEIRHELLQVMSTCGLSVECQQQRTGAQHQMVSALQAHELVTMSDVLMRYKHIVKRVSCRHGLTATFMPKPSRSLPGNGMRVQLSLWKDDTPLFAGTEYAGLSEVGLHAIGGILKHAPSLAAFTNPTTNSYARLLPECGGPINLDYSRHDEMSVCHIPSHSPISQDQRIEFRCPDPSCNPYLAFSALLMAVIDGIQNKIHPGDPAPPDDTSIPLQKTLPISLADALAALQEDHDFLLRGDVFSEDILNSWIRMKHEDEIEPLRRETHPYEVGLYFDV